MEILGVIVLVLAAAGAWAWSLGREWRAVSKPGGGPACDCPLAEQCRKAGRALRPVLDDPACRGHHSG